MKFTFKYLDKVVGVFVFVSIIILTGVTFILLNDTFRFFREDSFYYANFNDARGLSNADVVYKGFNIGKIKQTTIFEDESNNQTYARATILIYEEFKNKVVVNSVFNKSTSPLGGTTIEFIPNKQRSELIPEYNDILTLDSKEGKQLLEMGLIEAKEDSLTGILKNIDEILQSLNDDKNPEANSIARILVNVADITEQINKDLLIVENILYSTDGIFDNIEDLSEEISNPDNLVGRLVDPEGKIIFEPINRSLESLADALSELNELSQFLNAQSGDIETILLEGKNTLQEAQDVMEGLKNNPLLRGGISEKPEQETMKETIRDRDF